MTEKVKYRTILVLKGLVMGFADVIPGVSGGTMALVTGIYEELISALESFDPTVVVDLLRGRTGEFKEGLERIEFGFLVPLGLGIATALLVGSQFIRYLLVNYPPYTYSFFFGLILASAVLLYFEIPEVSGASLVTCLLGASAAVLIIGVSGGSFGHGLPVILAAGMIAVSAMILPGISGAFILLLIGQYEYILDSIGQLPRSLPTLLVFGLGAALGLVVFSRVLSFFLENWRSETLGFLIGLMVGALRKPFEVLIRSASNADIDFLWSAQSGILVALAGILGIVVVIGLGYIRLKENRSRQS